MTSLRWEENVQKNAHMTPRDEAILLERPSMRSFLLQRNMHLDTPAPSPFVRRTSLTLCDGSGDDVIPYSSKWWSRRLSRNSSVYSSRNSYSSSVAPPSAGVKVPNSQDGVCSLRRGFPSASEIRGHQLHKSVSAANLENEPDPVTSEESGSAGAPFAMCSQFNCCAPTVPIEVEDEIQNSKDEKFKRSFKSHVASLLKKILRSNKKKYDINESVKRDYEDEEEDENSLYLTY